MEDHSKVKEVVDKANRSEIARRTGMSLSGVSRILNGKRNPRSGNLYNIAQALGLNMDDLHAWLIYVKGDGRKRKVRAA